MVTNQKVIEAKQALEEFERGEFGIYKTVQCGRDPNGTYFVSACSGLQIHEAAQILAGASRT